MENKVVLHKGVYWPKKDGVEEITSSYAHPLSTCFLLMNTFKDVPQNISSFVDKKDVIIQAGGNAGYYVMQYAKIFNHVYTFEPDPINFFCLNMNVRSENVYKFQGCLGQINECVNLFNTNETLGHGGSHVNGKGHTPTFTIDNLNLETCDLIHLDIEGYEKFALLGGINTIKRCKPVIVVENYGPWLQRYNTNIEEIEKILSDEMYINVGTVQGDRVYKHISLL
jgi:FkbM family methyltransferase